MNLTYPIDALISYHYYRSGELMKLVTGPGHLRLIGDSGAFSAYTQGKVIGLAEYGEWCQQWRNYLYWIAALDVIGDPVATHRNWQTLRDVYRIDSIPTLHAGGDTKWLDVYAADGVDYVGLGGLVGVAPRAFRWLIHVFRYARDHHPRMRFHAWGVTSRKILEALPFYSADSSGIMSQSYRYGQQRLFDPQSCRDICFKLDGSSPFRHWALLTSVYGVEPRDIATSHAGNRALLVKLGAASAQQYAAWLQVRHKVTGPEWGLRNPASIGPSIHVAEQATDLSTLGPRIHVVDAGGGAAGVRDVTSLVPRHDTEKKADS